jgi:hypothetical protein
MCLAINFRMLDIFRIVEVGNRNALISGSVQTFDSEDIRLRHNQ